jgi:hypothetical protein
MEALPGRRAHGTVRFMDGAPAVASLDLHISQGSDEEMDRPPVPSRAGSDRRYSGRRAKWTWLAYNRRVDIVLEPKGTQSAEAYLNDAKDVADLACPYATRHYRTCRTMSSNLPVIPWTGR